MENLRPVIEELEKRREQSQSKGVDHALCSIIKLIKALEAKGIPPSDINEQLKALKNALNSTLKAGDINRIYRSITHKMLKEKKLVTPKYYQNLWMVLGMTAFGMPFGIVIFSITGNAAFISIGLPLGLPIGLAIGMQMDKKALAEGRALVYEE